MENNTYGMSAASKERLSNVAEKLDIAVDENKPDWKYSGKFSTMDYKMNARDMEAYINYILYREIDISLDIACDFAVEMLTEFDVDDDKLCELVGHFIQAKASLKCYGDAFDKLEREKMDEV